MTDQEQAATPTAPGLPPTQAPVRVVLVDEEISFGRKIGILFEWAVAGIPVALAFWLAYWLLLGLLEVLRGA